MIIDDEVELRQGAPGRLMINQLLSLLKIEKAYN